jgi:DNA-binding CsgD family transcriptional regulator
MFAKNAACVTDDASADGARALARALHQAALPLLLLAPDGTRLWTNQAGALLTQPPGPLHLLAGRVVARVPQAARVFAHALAEAALRPVIVRLPDAAGAPRQVQLLPIAGADAGPMVLLAADPGPGWRPAPELIAQALGLTRVQGQIVSLLCAGLGTEEVCARMRLSPHTLRAHLSLLLARTGVPNRTVLVSQVMQRVMPLLLLAAGGRMMPAVVPRARPDTSEDYLPGISSEAGSKHPSENQAPL